MTEVPPSEPTRRSRPDASMRRAVLRPTEQPSTRGPARRSLASALAAIPDREPSPVAARPAGGDGAVEAPPSELIDAGAPAPTEVESDAEPEAEDGAAVAGRARRVPAPRRHVPWFRRVAFALAVLALVGAIPALGWVGVRLIRNSKAGTFSATGSNPSAPGYEAPVEPTPTGVVIQRDANNKPISLTVLALGSTAQGGSVLFLPLDTRVAFPAYGVDRLRAAYAVAAPAVARSNLVARVADVLHIGFDEANVIDVNDLQWAALTKKVAPITFQNPDPLTVAGKSLQPGTVALAPEEVGPYLAALRPGESDLNRLNRHQVFWDAWLKAVGRSNDPAVIPGETGSGLGLFVRTLAKGTVRLTTLPLKAATGDPNAAFVPDDTEVQRLITDMVPAPIPPFPGARISLRVLNGVAGKSIGTDITRPLVAAGANILIVGNGRTFGNATTVYEYRDPVFKDRATLIRAALGNKGTLRLNRLAPDNVDVTVTLGRDVLGDQGGSGGVTTSGGAGG
ncbi:MAG: hypothetical protein JWN46_2067 [Acidimicrobiales bacterium]|nr:hypothetical protein [Acidimicrobiales bacterium]